MVRLVAATDSCWPVTWKRSEPNRSIGGSSSSHARIEVRASVDELSDHRIHLAEVVLGVPEPNLPIVGAGSMAALPVDTLVYYPHSTLAVLRHGASASLQAGTSPIRVSMRLVSVLATIELGEVLEVGDQ